MYVFPELLDMTKQEWPTEAHKIVAEKALLCNPRYSTMADLMEGARIIAEIPEERIKRVTAEDLRALGVMAI